MKILLGILFTILAISAQTSSVSAISENISEINVPYEVSNTIQNMWQGYIIYSVKNDGNTYTAVIARDGEPHQFPVRYITFDKSFKIIQDTGYHDVTPARPSMPVDEPIKPEEIPAPPLPESPKKQEKPDDTVVPEKPEEPKPPKKDEPPIIKPPEPEPAPNPSPEAQPISA